MSDRPCPACAKEQHRLRQSGRASSSLTADVGTIRSVDLFSGCGGISYGLARAARELRLRYDVALAVDSDAVAGAIFQRNIAASEFIVNGVETVFDGQVGEPLTPSERRVRTKHPGIDVLVGGPPCQGFSDLNNHTRRRDIRNELYFRMARAAEVLRPALILIENVPGVRQDTSGVVAGTVAALRDLDYCVMPRVVNMKELGVPQTRKRFIVLATRPPLSEPSALLDEAFAQRPCSHIRSVEWAIADIQGKLGTTAFDSPTKMTADNVARARWLVDNDAYDLPDTLRPPCHQQPHRYTSMYGRLHWTMPAQTITGGFGSMGQGRHVHPLEPRVLTPHEAARLQTFPDDFDFSVTEKRTAWAQVIGNAVPPLFNERLGAPLLRQLMSRSAQNPRPSSS